MSKKKVGLVLLLIAAAVGQAAAWNWDFIKGQDWEDVRRGMKLEKSSISKDEFYKCDNMVIVHQVFVGNPAEYGGLVLNKDGKTTRRYPSNDSINLDSSIGVAHIQGKASEGELVSIRCSSNSSVHFVVWQDVEWYKLSAKTRYFVLTNGEIVFEKNRQGFRLKSATGTLLENKNFKTIAGVDAMMNIYSGVPGSLIRSTVEAQRSSKGTKEQFAGWIVSEWVLFAGGLGALSGAAPVWALPLEFAGNFQGNLQKAYMAYAIACALGKDPGDGSDEFVTDLYVLLDDSPLDKTLDVVAKAANYTGAVDDLLKAGAGFVAKIGKTKFGVAVANKVASRVAAKFVVKGFAKVASTVSATMPMISAAMSASQASIFGAKALKYYMAK